MAIATYKNLEDSIKAWSKRTELDPLILADLISMTEIKIDNSDLRLTSEEDTETTALATDDNYLSLPPRYKAMRAIRIQYGDVRQHLLYVTPSRFRFINTPGKPKAYTITNTIEFDRKPDSNYTVYLDHYQTLNPLDSSNPDSTNNILTKYPIIYLYGALEEVFNYVLDEKRAAGYRAKFYQMVNMANSQESMGRYPADHAPTPPGDVV